MAPEGVGAVDKMKTYSTEFEAGQPGFLLIDADVSASPEIFNTNFDSNDPYDALVGIEELKKNAIKSTKPRSVNRFPDEGNSCWSRFGWRSD